MAFTSRTFPPFAALLSLSLAIAACGGDDDDGGGDDMADDGSGGADDGSGGADAPADDGADAPADDGADDAPPADDGGSSKALGEDCTSADECSDGKCLMFEDDMGNQYGFCTRTCTSADDCPEEGWECNLAPYTACVPA